MDILSKLRYMTPDEINFYYWVCNNPGCKYYPPSGSCHVEDNGKYISLWTRLEEYGLIEAVGSYKWKALNPITLSDIIEQTVNLNEIRNKLIPIVTLIEMLEQGEKKLIDSAIRDSKKSINILCKHDVFC